MKAGKYFVIPVAIVARGSRIDKDKRTDVEGTEVFWSEQDAEEREMHPPGVPPQQEFPKGSAILGEVYQGTGRVQPARAAGTLRQSTPSREVLFSDHPERFSLDSCIPR